MTTHSMANTTKSTLDINGTTIVYDDAGHGAPPMLLVHGWGGDRSHLAPQLAHFSHSHRVVAIDRRGHGESGKPDQDEPAGQTAARQYTIESASDDLAELVRRLGLDRVVMV